MSRSAGLLRAGAPPGDLEARILAAVEASADPERLRQDLELFLPVCTMGVSRAVETACIRRAGGRCRIEFGEAFLRDQLADGRDLLFVLLHEAFHHVLGHLVALPPWLRSPRMRDVANVAADMLVNRAVCTRFFPGGVPLLARMYDRSSIVGTLLLPPRRDAAGTGPEVRSALLRAGWPSECVWAAWLAYRAAWFEEVPFEALAGRVLDLFRRAACACDVTFLGDHRPDRPRPPGLPWSGDEEGCGAGHGDRLEEEEVDEPVEPALSPELAAAVRRALTEDPNHPRRRATRAPTTSPIYAPGRSDWLPLALGFWPALFHGDRFDTADDDQCAHVYVDVSGSFDRHLARVYGLLLGLADEVGRVVHQFSNQVADATLDELARGVKRTTGGTDFDCVFEHASERRYRRIVIVTDGLGELESGLAEAFTASGASLYLVLQGTDEASARVWSPLPALARGVWVIA